MINDKCILPPKLTKLALCVCPNFNQLLEIPVTLTDLVILWRVNPSQGIGALGPNLTKLVIGHEFNQPILLPASLTCLMFSDSFNQPLEPGVFPENLTRLGFGTDFNQPIKRGVLPKNLKSLVFGNNFNPPDQVSFEGLYCLMSIVFGDMFNRPLNQFPKTLNSLTFGLEYNIPFDIKALPRLFKLIVSGRFYRDNTMILRDFVEMSHYVDVSGRDRDVKILYKKY